MTYKDEINELLKKYATNKGCTWKFIDKNCACDHCTILNFKKIFHPTDKTISQYLIHPHKIIRTGAKRWYYKRHTNYINQLIDQVRYVLS